MKRSKVIPVEVHIALKAFGLSAATVCQLEKAGYLPLRPHGKVTVHWLKRVARYCMSKRGMIPADGQLLLDAHAVDGKK